MDNCVDFSHSALANADSEFTASFIIFQMTIAQLKMVDEIAATTQSLRAVAQAHLMRKDVLAMTAGLQHYLSYRMLSDSGESSMMTSGNNATKFHLSVLTQDKP